MRTDSMISIPQTQTMKFLHLMSLDMFQCLLAYSLWNLNRICVLLLCENCINLNYVELVHSAFQVYYILLLFCLFILLIFESLILKLQLKILIYLQNKVTYSSTIYYNYFQKQINRYFSWHFNTKLPQFIRMNRQKSRRIQYT